MAAGDDDRPNRAVSLQAPGQLVELAHNLPVDELARAKVQLKSENVMRGEGSGSRMGALAHSWWYERKLRTIQEVKAAIDAVTEEQALAVLRRFSPFNALTVAAIGPLEQEALVGKTL